MGPWELAGVPRSLPIPFHLPILTLDMPLVWLCRALDFHLGTGSSYKRRPK